MGASGKIARMIAVTAWGGFTSATLGGIIGAVGVLHARWILPMRYGVVLGFFWGLCLGVGMVLLGYALAGMAMGVSAVGVAMKKGKVSNKQDVQDRKDAQDKGTQWTTETGRI